MTFWNDARIELAQKTRAQIEEETATKWAARAAAAHERYQQTGNVQWLRDFEDYLHEAIEHAAFADETGVALQSLRAWARKSYG